MKITFLGTGTSQGIPVIACKCEVCLSNDERDKRLRSSLLIETDDLTIVIDSGPDFRQQMLRANVEKLDAILLTHEHYDHIMGLDDIRAFNWVTRKATNIYAETRVQLAIKRVFSYVFAQDKYPGIPQMILHDLTEEPFYIENQEIVPIRGMHYQLPIFGFKVGNVAYLTDFKEIDDAEIDKLKGIKCLILNALQQRKHISHLTLEEALVIIEKVKPETAYLTHVSHSMGLHAEASKLLPQNVKFAYDSLVLNI